MPDIQPIQNLETKNEANRARAKNVLAIQTYINEVVLGSVRKYSAIIIVAGITLVVGNITGYIVGVGKLDPRVSATEVTIVTNKADSDARDTKQDEAIAALQKSMDKSLSTQKVFGAKQDLMLVYFHIPVPADQ